MQIVSDARNNSIFVSKVSRSAISVVRVYHYTNLTLRAEVARHHSSDWPYSHYPLTLDDQQGRLFITLEFTNKTEVWCTKTLHLLFSLPLDLNTRTRAIVWNPWSEALHAIGWDGELVVSAIDREPNVQWCGLVSDFLKEASFLERMIVQEDTLIVVESVSGSAEDHTLRQMDCSGHVLRSSPPSDDVRLRGPVCYDKRRRLIYALSFDHVRRTEIVAYR